MGNHAFPEMNFAPSFGEGNNIKEVKPASMKKRILSPWAGNLICSDTRMHFSRGSMLIVARFAFIARQ